MRLFLICAALFAISEALFLIRLDVPDTYNFDESYYVPAARDFINMKDFGNVEHPPLGKEIIAGGMSLFGDEPFGWRVSSTVFGALTLVGMFLLGCAVFEKEPSAWWAAGLTLFNYLLFVQARVALLDTFMFAFSVFALAALAYSIRGGNRHYIYIMGLFLGMAIASKWSGLVTWAICLACFIWLRSFTHVRWPAAALGFFLLPVITYFATYTPFLRLEGSGATPFTILKLQRYMWEFQTELHQTHGYMSEFWQWPLLMRPMWYHFQADSSQPDSFRGVFFGGNPLIMLGGILALVVCAWDFLREKNRAAGWIVIMYAGFYLSWAAIPRKVSYYYYYYPAGMALSFALAYALSERSWAGPMNGFIRKGRWIFLAGSIALFVFFYPILAAMLTPFSDVDRWMWFHGDTWRWFEYAKDVH